MVTLLGTALALQMAACATSGAVHAPMRSIETIGALTIANQTTGPMRIYLRSGSSKVAIGTVRGLESRSLPFPDGFAAGGGELQLEARSHGAADVILSDRFTLPRGRVATWILNGATPTTVSVR